MTKRKADCTAEEWSKILEGQREANRVANRRYYQRNREKVQQKIRQRRQREPVKLRHDAYARAARHWLETFKPAKADPSDRLAETRQIQNMPQFVKLVLDATRRIFIGYRDDAASELVIALLAGDIGVEDLSGAATHYAKAQRNAEFNGHVSIDDVIPGAIELRLADTIPNDAFHF